MKPCFSCSWPVSKFSISVFSVSTVSFEDECYQGGDNLQVDCQIFIDKAIPKDDHLVWISFGFYGWAFGVIPLLQKQVKDCTDEVSHPRILRWLDEKSNSRIKEVDPFNPPDDALSLLSSCAFMDCTHSTGVGDDLFYYSKSCCTITDPMMDLIKKELAGATTIRKVARQGPNVEALHDQPAATDLGATSRGIAGGVVDVGGSHDDADASATRYSGAIGSHFVATDYSSIVSVALDRVKQLAYSDAYDVVDRIMDLNFYKNFKNRYDKLIVQESTPDDLGFDLLFSIFEWDEDITKYVRRKRPYPGDKD
ncbi:hypothetical protein FXO38_25539 [Capsicum annuum]|nr:hypothetical protein FXO38_25539 [Capsicum annuum]